MLIWFYCQPWDFLLVFMPLCVLLYGIVVYTAKKRSAGKALRIVCGLCFIFWLSVVLYSTVLGRAGNETLGLQPLFESYRRFDEQPELIRQCFMNVLLYFPGGLCLAAALPEKWYKSVKLILPVVLLFLLSVGTEYMQFIRFLGLAEMDDVMHNTIGALCGSGTVYFISRITM